MIRQPNMISKSLAIITITCMLIFIGITAYLVSALKAEINSDLFTISQALAFGNKPGMIILIICSLSVLSYLLYYRGHKYLYFRLLLNLNATSETLNLKKQETCAEILKSRK